jgi:outer membrane protein TolC
MIKSRLIPKLFLTAGAFMAFSGSIRPCPAHGQESPLTLGDCINLAMAQNPLVQSAREQFQASIARVRQARAFPQPSLDIDSDLQPELTDFGGYGERYIGISQTIPFPGKTYLRGRVAREESNQVSTDLDNLVLDVTFQVTESYYAVLLAEERLEYAAQNQEFAQDFLAMTELKFEAGDVPRVEVVRASVEAATAGNQLRRAENELRLAKARVNFLLGQPSSSPLELQGQLKTDPVSYDLDEITGWALELRPEIRRINHAIARENLVKKQGFASYLPDFEVGAARHKIVGEETTWDVTLSLALPVFFWQPARGEIAEANANLRALREEAAHLANAVSLEVEAAYVELTAADNQIRLFEEEILAQAEEAFEMYQFSYEQGEIGGFELIQARRTLNEARTSYVDALFNYDVARAAIEKSMGRLILEQ